MAEILAFGDSNTWGFVPGSKDYSRYPEDVRWTGLLQKKISKASVIEEGLCGRTTIFEDSYRPGRKGVSSLATILKNHTSLGAVVLMLGTNDCKSIYKASAQVIGNGIEECLKEIEKVVPAEKILLVSPIFLGEDVWREDKDPEFEKSSIAVSHELKDVYRSIAKKHGNAFLAASDYADADPADNEHLNEKGHRAFAGAVYEKLLLMDAV
ncbi:MAG: arylesterase [Lachnospiraceae bacterium]|jgi:lysophospholipase L1-like esterase|nr:arylesterase [Lachnospiraceae bacterium]MBR4588932.1 arylesterase [Lachnospiraceae bacterium]